MQTGAWSLRAAPASRSSSGHADSAAPFRAAFDVRGATFIGPQPLSTRTSASYSMAAETFDAGGTAVLSSASYSIKDASAGTVGALARSTGYTAKGGYAGQLYEVTGLGVSGASASVNEGGTLQLSAAPLLDDRTLLSTLTSGVNWSVVSGPLASVSSGGLATAAIVYQNTPATVRASSGGLTGTGILTVLNVNLDDFGAYAGDGIDDAWQVAYFGLDNPQAAPGADADGTGQNNLFKYLAGLNPLDPNSRFSLVIQPISGQPMQKTLTLSPVYSGRTYTVQSASTLTQPNWTTLTNATVSDTGTTRTLIDPSASGAVRFYRVQVSMP